MCQEKNVKKDEKIENLYPSAELLQNACFEDYQRLLSSYDKIYEKINFALAFCGVILFVVVDTVDYTYLIHLFNANTSYEIFTLLVYIVSSFCSIFFVINAVVELLFLLRSKKIQVFNSVDIVNEGIYKWDVQCAATWLIDKYTKLVLKLRPIVNEKQKKFDQIMKKIVIGLVLCSISIIVKKGIGV